MITRNIAHRASILSCQSLKSTTFASRISGSPILTSRQQSTLAYSRSTLHRPNRSPQSCHKPSIYCQAVTQARYTSSAASPIAAAASVNSAKAAPQPLTWNRFLEIRKVRRQINVIASIIGVGGALFLSMYVITSQDVDVLAQNYLGLDALITMGIIVVGTSAAGWLIGPIFGNAIFNLRYRALRSSILEKEKEFFQRIAKHRVDPTRSSYQNPVPDYYGEKIGSVRDYRRWLKDQRAFNLKRAG